RGPRLLRSPSRAPGCRAGSARGFPGRGGRGPGRSGAWRSFRVRFGVAARAPDAAARRRAKHMLAFPHAGRSMTPPGAATELEVLTGGDPRLGVRCAPVASLDARACGESQMLMAALTAFRARHGFGRGIAAPQLGFSSRVLALDLGAGPFTLFNPEIVWRSAE